MTKLKRSTNPSSVGEANTIGPPRPGAFALSAQTVVRRDEIAVPNRALALLERDGDTWRFVRAHLWFQGTPSVAVRPRLARSRS